MHVINNVFLEEIYSSVPRSHLEVSLAYQDLPTGITGRKFLHDVLKRCQKQVELSLTLWNLALFHLPEILEQAVLNVCESNLVVMSLRGDSELKPEAEVWLTEWIAGRGEEECALAVLIGCGEQRLDLMGRTLLWLQQITRSTEVRLFVGFMPSNAPEQVPSSHDAPEESEPQVYAVSDIPNSIR